MPVLTSYQFSKTSLSLWTGDRNTTVELRWAPSASDYRVVYNGTVMTSSDSSVAYMNKGGSYSGSYMTTILTAAGPGTATITAQYTDDDSNVWSTSITVTVTDHTLVIVNEDSLESIADAIRDTYGTSSTYKPGEMAEAIRVNGVGIPRQIKTYSSGGSDPYDYLAVPSTTTSFSLPSNISQLSKYALAYAFTEDSVSASSTSRMLQSVDLSHIKSISEYGLYRAFSHCRNLESADLSSLTRVGGDYAMYGVFDGCCKLTSLDLSNLTSAGGEYSLCNAFANNSSTTSRLASVNLSALAEAGGHSLEGAFRNCVSLTSISFPSLTKVDSNTFNRAFSGCTSLTSFSISNDLTRYRFYPSSCFLEAFYGCTALTSVSFSGFTGENPSTSVWSSMFSKAFYGCTSLTTVSFPELTYIASSMFNEAFTNCSALTSLSFPKATAAGTNAFYKAAQTGCSSLASASFPELLTAEGNAFANAFNDCSSFTTFSAPKLHTAGRYSFNYAFRGTGLTSISFPALATFTDGYVFERAFTNCTSLTSVTFDALENFPVNGYSYFSNAFYGCSSLASVNFPALTVSGLGTYNGVFSNMLTGTSGVTLHFPDGLQTKIASMSGYPNFGGTNTTVLFDL